jgi:hypothetical protein
MVVAKVPMVSAERRGPFGDATVQPSLPISLQTYVRESHLSGSKSKLKQ